MKATSPSKVKNLATWTLAGALALTTACKSADPVKPTPTATATSTATATTTSTSTNTAVSYNFPANPGKVCTVDRFNQAADDSAAVKKLDMLFVMDHSGSMSANWARVSQNIQAMVKELPADLDISYAVILADGAPLWKGKLYAASNVPVVLSNQRYSTAAIATYLGKSFAAAMNSPDDLGSGEAAFLSLYHATTTYAVQNQKLGFFRPDAALSILFMSDEDEIGNPFPKQAAGLPPRCDATYEDNVKKTLYTPSGINYVTTFSAVKKLKGDMPVVTHAFVNITADDLFKNIARNSSCTYENLGYGYFEMVDQTKGVLFSIKADQAQGMARCGQVTRERLALQHDFTLSKAADKVDAASIIAAVDGAKVSSTYSVANNSVNLPNAGVAGSKIEIQHCEPVVQPTWTIGALGGQSGQHAASLTWSTPEYATSSKVNFGLSESALNQSANISGSATNHVVTVSGLNANTLYYFQGVSSDEFGVEKKSNVMSLRTKPDWSLSVAAGQASRNSVNISWKTPEYATTGKVLYGAAANALGQQSAVTAATLDHSVTIDGLNANSTYYFQVVASDEYGLEKRGDVQAATTISDWAIVGFNGTPAQTSVALVWQTPDYATSGKILYGTSASALNSSVNEGSSDGKNHSVSVTGLSPNVTYYFQAVGTDNLGVSKQSAVIALKTTADWNIVNFAGTASQNAVTVSWNTPEYATSGKVLYGSSASALNGMVVDAAGSSMNHSAAIGGLADDTVYYFQAVSSDNYGLTKSSGVVAIRTPAAPVVVTPKPVWTMNNFNGLSTTNSVTVTFKTSEYATTGSIRYGLAESALNSSMSENVATTDHQLVAANLTADTVYYFQAVASDDFGQTQNSSVIAVRTLPETTTTPSPIADWTLQGFDGTTSVSTLTLIWTTPGAFTKASISIGTSASDLSLRTVEVADYADTHQLSISGLNANTSYYAQVTAVDANGRTQQSAVLLKKTKAQ